MDLIKLKKLIDQKASCYQDIEIDGQLLAKGSRDNCGSRWDLLKPHIKPNKVIIDVGSDLGYFSQRIAREIEGSVVLSFEQAPDSAKIQKELFKQLELFNIAVCQYKLTIETLQRLSQATEMIDTIMFLAVLHHYEEDEEKRILKLCSELIPEIIVEYVVQVGPGAWGGKAYLDFEKLLPDYYDHVEIIGVSHDGPSEKRIIIKAWNDKVNRVGLNGTVSKKYTKKVAAPNHKLSYQNGEWILASKVMTEDKTYPNVHKNLITGVNCHSLMWFNTIWPATGWFQKQGKKAYINLLDKNIKISNIHIPNLIFSHKGIQPIEYVRLGANYSAAAAKKDIEKVVKEFKIKKNYV